jgi:hypothetical protein
MPAIRTLSATLQRLAIAASLMTAASPAFAQAGATAHLWVNGTGGSCTRSANPAAYDPATACATGADAWNATRNVSAASTIRFTPGNHPGFSVQSTRTTTTEYVTFQGAPDVTITDKIQFGCWTCPSSTQASYVRLKNLRFSIVSSGVGAGVNRYGVYFFGGHHFRAENITAGSFAVWYAQDIQVLGGSLGPCSRGQDGPNGCTINYAEVVDNILYDGVEFHGYGILPECKSACHWRPMFANGVHGFTLRNSTFRNNVFEPWTTISGDGARGNHNILIENNEFGANVQTPSGTGGAFGLAWCQNASSGVDGYKNVTIRFNSTSAGGHFGAPDTVTSTGTCRISNVRIYGNIARHPTSCQISGPGTGIGTVTWGHNVFVGPTNRTCGPGDIYVGGTTSFYTNNTTTPAVGDFALTAGLTPADNRVPTAAGCPAIDRLGVARPQDAGFCDAGAHERAGAGGAAPPTAPGAPANLRIVAAEGGTVPPTPSTPLDSFDRADATSLGGNWTNQTSARIGVSGNRAVAGGGAAFHCAYWTAATASSDQFSQVVVRTVSPSTRYVFATVRASGTTDASRSHYYIGTDGSGGAGHLELNKVVNGTISGIAAFNTSFGDGDLLRLEVQGTRLRVYKNGTQLGPDHTDSSLTSGQPGMCLYGTGAAADDWTAGATSGTP